MYIGPRANGRTKVTVNVLIKFIYGLGYTCCIGGGGQKNQFDNALSSIGDILQGPNAFCKCRLVPTPFDSRKLIGCNIFHFCY